MGELKGELNSRVTRWLNKVLTVRFAASVPHLVLLHVVQRGKQGHVELLDEHVLLRLEGVGRGSGGGLETAIRLTSRARHRHNVSGERTARGVIRLTSRARHRHEVSTRHRGRIDFSSGHLA
eukprot:343402-Prorocentrum_minimum.AAC.1